LSLTGEIHYKIEICSVKSFTEELTADYTDKTDLGNGSSVRINDIRDIRGFLFFGLRCAKMSADGR